MERIWLIPVAGVAAVLFALWLAWDVLRRDAGTPEMQEISDMIFEGAMAFLRRQYRTIAIMAAVTAVVIFVIVGGVSEGVKEIVRGDAGQISFGETVTSRWEEALLTSIAFRVGAVSRLGSPGIFAIYSRLLDNPPETAPFLIVGFGFGASFVALFAQLGGGIYTKAADMGAALGGKGGAGVPA